MGSVEATTIPTHSIPSTRGNVTFGECPCRVLSSDRFKPAPLTCTRLQPSRTAGSGSSRISSTSGPPALTQTAARIVVLISHHLYDVRSPATTLERCNADQNADYGAE